MQPGSILINASRGTVVDIDALADALQSGALGGAGIDVFPVEPRSNDDEFVSPLRRFDNTFLTPHIGGSTTMSPARCTNSCGRRSNNHGRRRSSSSSSSPLPP